MSSKKSFNSYDLSIVCKRAYPICAIWRVLKANNRSISRVYGLKSTFAPQSDVKFRGEIAISVNVIVFFPTIHGFSPLPLGSIVRMHPTKWTSRQSSAFSAQAFSFSKSKKRVHSGFGGTDAQFLSGRNLFSDSSWDHWHAYCVFPALGRLFQFGRVPCDIP